jgi:DNA-directed RNA polymerase specialized sigma24 family protein
MDGTVTDAARGAGGAGEEIADGAPDSLAELYARHAPAGQRLGYFLTGDREMAEDLVQDAFVRLAGHFRHLRRPDAFDAYLRRTIVNLFTSHLRRLRLERAHLARERAERWPADAEAAVVLRFYEDLSEKETAEVLGCSPSAVNSLVSRAMATLRYQMRSEER